MLLYHTCIDLLDKQFVLVLHIRVFAVYMLFSPSPPFWKKKSLNFHLCGSGPRYPAFTFKDRLIEENMRSFLVAQLSANITQLTDADWIHAMCQHGPRGTKHSTYVCRFVSMNEPDWKGCFVSTLYWAPLHYWYAIWLPAINKLLRNWKLLSWGLTASELFGPR